MSVRPGTTPEGSAPLEGGTSERWEFLPDNEVTLEDSLCVVARVTNFGGPEERAARGLLIAAAPDMLEACKALIDFATSAPPIELIKRLDACVVKAATAYAKATGQ